MIEKVKLAIGIVCLIFIFLPLGSCERNSYVPSLNDDSNSTNTGKCDKISLNQIEDNVKIEFLIPINEFEFSKPKSWLMVVVFIWPLLILSAKKHFGKKGWKQSTLSILEFLISGFSIYFIFSLLFRLWYTPTKWGYFAYFFAIFYFLLVLLELLNKGILLRSKRI